MKKSILLLSFFCLFNFLSFAQVNHIVIERESENKTEEVPKDIGGVDFTFNREQFIHRYYKDDSWYSQSLDKIVSITVTNYNPFPVTVKFEYTVYGTRVKELYDRGLNWRYITHQKNEIIVLPPYSSSNPYNSSKKVPVSIGSGAPIDIENFTSVVTKVGE